MARSLGAVLDPIGKRKAFSILITLLLHLHLAFPFSIVGFHIFAERDSASLTILQKHFKIPISRFGALAYHTHWALFQRADKILFCKEHLCDFGRI